MSVLANILAELFYHFFLEMKSSEWKHRISLLWGKACIPLVMTDSHCGNDRFISTWLLDSYLSFKQAVIQVIFSRWLKASLGYKKSFLIQYHGDRMPLSSLLDHSLLIHSATSTVYRVYAKLVPRIKEQKSKPNKREFNLKTL